MPNVDTDRRWRRAWRYIEANQTAPARAALESILLRSPSDTRARVFLAAVCASENQPRAAAEQVRLAAALPSDDPAVLMQLASIATKVGEIGVARKILVSAVLAGSSDPGVSLSVAQAWQLLGDNSAALASVERAVRLGVHSPELHFCRGVQLAFSGNLLDAERAFQRCVALGPSAGHAYLQLARLRKQTSAHNHVAGIAHAVAKVIPGSEDHVALQFALYKELEDLARYADAWQALVLGNRLVHAKGAYDVQRATTVFTRLRELCSETFLHSVNSVQGEGPQPIFVMGLPRSGTTLLERILGNHSHVESAGELAAFWRALSFAVDHFVPLAMPDDVTLDRLTDVDWRLVAERYLAQSQWRARGKSFYVDKLPRNWMLAGLVHKAFPRAPIFNLIRDPMDVCFSNWRAHLGDGPDYAYAYDLAALAAHHRLYQQMLGHWHRTMPGAILDVDYGRLVHEPEVVAHEVFAFCGLEPEPGCTDLTRNRATSATLSMAQVRGEIRTDEFARWKPYAEGLSGLAKALMTDTPSQRP